MKRIILSLLILSLYGQESSDSSDGEGAVASTSAQAARRHRCPVEGCGKSFDNKMHFTRHERTHTGERPFPCDICEKSFSLSCNLNTHKLTHTGERPYHCDICKKSFSRSDTLTVHNRSRAHRNRELAQNIFADTHDASSCETSESVPPELPHAAETPQQQSSPEEDFDPAIYLNLEDYEEDKDEPSPKRQRLEKDNV